MDSDRRAARDRMTPAARRLELLRARRTSQGRDTSLAPSMAGLRRHLEKQASQTDPLRQTFDSLVPTELASRCKIRLDKGVLRVGVADSSIRYALDRLLRAGVRDQIIRQSQIPIRDIKLEARTSRPRRAGGRASTTRSTNDRSS
ncbi:MAG: hypothetical protein ED559_00200 [Phycisphaera sp.]|nr:MAG: hypothetical protein ED559_00200 [Phycisphaera sp.]